MNIMGVKLALASGALKNAGDFLITHKCEELIKHYMNPEETLVFKRDKTLANETLKEINQMDAIIICGGPGYGKHFYPHIYPFLQAYDKIKPPIIPFGLGWSGRPRYKPEKFKFTQESLTYIRKIHDRIPFSSTRDEITRQILLKHGIDNVINTGCPTLINFEKQGEEFRKPEKIEKIAVSMPQSPGYHNQSILLLKEIKEMFPEAEKIATFHRGTSTDKYTTKYEGKALHTLVSKTTKLGYQVEDLSYGYEKLDIYKEMDIHVGYRVHAHAHCINNRIPTFLLWEDGRGMGMTLNTETPGIPAQASKMRLAVERIPIIQRYNIITEKYLEKIPFMNKDKQTVHAIMKIMKEEIESGFKGFQRVPSRLQSLQEEMERYFSEINAQLI